MKKMSRVNEMFAFLNFLVTEPAPRPIQSISCKGLFLPCLLKTFGQRAYSLV